MQRTQITVFCLLMLSGTSRSRADEPTVTVTGKHVDYIQPDTVRMRCRIFAEGSYGRPPPPCVRNK